MYNLSDAQVFALCREIQMGKNNAKGFRIALIIALGVVTLTSIASAFLCFIGFIAALFGGSHFSYFTGVLAQFLMYAASIVGSGFVIAALIAWKNKKRSALLFIIGGAVAFCLSSLGFFAYVIDVLYYINYGIFSIYFYGSYLPRVMSIIITSFVLYSAIPIIIGLWIRSRIEKAPAVTVEQSEP